jgi:hypothetical protein
MNEIICALRWNNTSSPVRCFGCDASLNPEIGHHVVAANADFFAFLCDACAARNAPELLALRELATYLGFLYEGHSPARDRLTQAHIETLLGQLGTLVPRPVLPGSTLEGD